MHVKVENVNGLNVERHQCMAYCPLINQIIMVDKNCVPILKELWTLDMFALSGCAENNDHQVCLEFSDRNDIEEFLWHICRAVGKIDGAPNNLRERIFGMHLDRDASDDQSNWTYNAEVYDLGEESDAKNECEEKWPFSILVAIRVIFPRSDYDFVFRAIKRVAEARRPQNWTAPDDALAADVGEQP